VSIQAFKHIALTIVERSARSLERMRSSLKAAMLRLGRETA